jgi:selenide,water dikinase
MMAPLAEVHLTVVVDHHEAVYSGMVPGLAAGDCASADLTIDVLPLARRAGARCIHAALVGVDPVARRLELEGRPSIPYDVASLDIGSTVRRGEVAGSGEQGIATRPIARFVSEIERRLAAGGVADSERALRVVVVGAGVAGVELAFCVEARLRALGRPGEVTVVACAGEILPGGHRALAPRVEREMARRGITVHRGGRVQEARPGELRLTDESSRSYGLPCDLALWATGPAAHALLAASALPCDERGFVRVRSTLQVEGHDDLFAVGDCAHLIDHPWVPRAGVYAVRSGPYLDRNLRARLEGRKLTAYRPQRDFLALLNLGDGRAIGGKWGMTFEGRAVWRLKDWIDRRFMRRFQVLDADGRPAPGFPALTGAMTGSAASGEGDAMECGGCAAKVGPSALHAALARLDPPPPDPSVRLGLAAADDAAAFQLPGGDIVLATLDAFRAFADDPWLVGRVAAVNAVSDLLAKGARPRHALALVTVPRGTPSQNEEVLYQVLAGVRAALDPLGVSLVGGHSTAGPELFVGLSVTGDAAPGGRVLGIDGLEPGDCLVLTKPLGTGVLLAADARGLAPARWVRAATASMLRDNASAARLALEFGARACTDVSGFGFAGHLHEMLSASAVEAEIDAASLPLLPGAADLTVRGLRSSFFEQNAGRRSEILQTCELKYDFVEETLFDPQTSGGLLIGAAPERADALVEALCAGGDGEAAVVGRVVAAGPAPSPSASGGAGAARPRIRLESA